MPITMRELGKATGYSVATFSRAFNGRSHLASYETKQQLLSVAKELGYRPNLIGHSLHTVRTNTIGLMVDNILRSICLLARVRLKRQVLFFALSSAHSFVIVECIHKFAHIE